MTQDVAEVFGDAVGRAARNALQNVSVNRKRRGGALSGPKAVVAGVGLGTLAPLVAKGARSIAKKATPDSAEPLKKAGEKLGNVKDAVGEKAEQAGGGGDSKGMPGVGKGRRMPIQQDIDIGVPLKTVYNQWTQFED